MADFDLQDTVAVPRELYQLLWDGLPWALEAGLKEWAPDGLGAAGPISRPWRLSIFWKAAILLGLTGGVVYLWRR